MADKPVLSDPITLRLPLDILEDVEKIAETADRSRSWVIVRALKYYLMHARQGPADLEKDADLGEGG